VADQPETRDECLKAAKQAMQWADQATNQTLRDEYIMLATDWLKLLSDVQKSNSKSAI
jgi:hypothetical protein